MATLHSLKYSRQEKKCLEVLDQLKVPHNITYVPVTNSEEAWAVIRSMQVRGAPLIAIVAALGLSVEVSNSKLSSTLLSANDASEFLQNKMDYLRTSRPTAVNLFKCTDELAEGVRNAASEPNASTDSVIKWYVDAAEAMLEADLSANKAIGDFGADAMIENRKATTGKDGPMNVMTICNTGSLATVGYGTALGVVRSLHSRKLLEQVYACETRPYNQGSRLTAFEIVVEEMPGTLICDSMAAACMREKKVDAVVVGADRVANNGDTANKIGTYQLAITAKHHGAAFYVAAPSTSCDINTPNGDSIEIEERPAQELRCTAGVQIAPEAINVWNPAFDYTPASLITGIITEHGVIHKQEGCEGFDVSAYLARFETSDKHAKHIAKKQKANH